MAEANKLSEEASKTPPPKSPVPGASPAKKGIPQGLLDKVGKSIISFLNECSMP